ncbi:MAG TPA: DUF892 family protein [Micrococcaceae bacterium]|jgi:ferritin-like metal-binding protein YciE|nr:DUF892 family protein [Micrococcaceae bacterium]
MFEHLNTPKELFQFKLGSAMSMEDDSLAMLGDLEQAAQRQELKQLFRTHAEETRQQITNLQRIFGILNTAVDKSPSPTTQGLAKEGKSTIRKTATELVDAVAVAGALETEHYEIAVYQTLIATAEANVGWEEIATLLKQNLSQEKAASEKLLTASQEVAREAARSRQGGNPPV